MSDFTTEQEEFWASSFGDEYTARNQGEAWVASNKALFQKVLAATQDVGSVLELGANAGLNLLALQQLLPDASLAAVEINETAVAQLKALEGIEVHHASLLEFEPGEPADLVLVKGVLIHINPESLGAVYDLMHRASRRYICLTEYFNPTPVEIPYRGHEGKLFKRDFAGELLDRHSDLRLVDYGFVYHRDPEHPQDDVTWFLLEKAQPG